MTAPARHYAIVGYPLSKTYRERFEAAAGVRPEYFQLSELRKSGLKGMLRTLRAMRGDTLYLPLEEATLRMILPVLELVSYASSNRRIVLVDPDLSHRSLSRAQAPAALSRLFAACADGQRAVVAAGARARELMDVPLQRVAPVHEPSVLYLKTNLMLGVRAGGSIGHIAGVVNGLVRLGYDVDFAGAEQPVGLDASTHWSQIPLMPSFGMPFETNYYRYHEIVSRELTARTRAPGFVYQRMSVSNFSGVEVARRFRVPLVMEYNGSEAWIAKHWGTPLRYHDLAVLTEDVSLKHSHLVVTISDVLRDELLAKGVPARRIVTYPNGIDPGVFDPARFSAASSAALRERLGIPANATVVTFVGTFGLWHGTELLAKAVKRWAETDPASLERGRVRFLFVGDGLRFAEVKKTLSGAAAPYVVLTGLVEQEKTPAYLAASDILVSPHVPNADGTRFFGSPTKLFEYMAMGKGIVASRLEQIEQVLNPSVDAARLPTNAAPTTDADGLAVTTTPGSEDELLRGLRFLVENPAWRERLGANARAAALARYTWDHHVDAILDGLAAQGLVRVARDV